MDRLRGPDRVAADGSDQADDLRGLLLRGGRCLVTGEVLIDRHLEVIRLEIDRDGGGTLLGSVAETVASAMSRNGPVSRCASSSGAAPP
jgi:hypothetical protein